ncbi:MAG TPA: Uma2 family endonuclease [Thermodesulfobacteriota bacterium]|nr:Uma2 family endonuclease [Thermodesulfobacteriota bacterium]
MEQPKVIEKIRLTYEDYLLLPDDRNRYEILDGELNVTPAPTTKHQTVSVNLLAVLYGYVREHKLGKIFSAPMDVILDDSSIVQPDLIFINKERAEIITEKNVQGAPDLVIEILSPSTAKVDRLRKMQIYLRYGIKHYWLVDPDAETLEVYRLESGKYHVASGFEKNDVFEPEPFPGLRIKLSEIWE